MHPEMSGLPPSKDEALAADISDAFPVGSSLVDLGGYWRGKAFPLMDQVDVSLVAVPAWGSRD